MGRGLLLSHPRAEAASTAARRQQTLSHSGGLGRSLVGRCHQVQPSLSRDRGISLVELSLTDPPQIVFDECHKAKNASSTKMGKAVLDLQNKLPLARVVYASATGGGLQGPQLGS